MLYGCLFATQGLDLRAPLRAGAADDELLQLIGGFWHARRDRYSELRGRADVHGARVEMNYVGG
jgi:cyclic pyranopterin phosphate synthase